MEGFFQLVRSFSEDRPRAPSPKRASPKKSLFAFLNSESGQPADEAQNSEPEKKGKGLTLLKNKAQTLNKNQTSSSTPQLSHFNSLTSEQEEEKRAQQAKFEDLFGFPAHERLLDITNCTYSRNVLFVPGRLYISDKYICFSEITGFKVIIPFREVLDIEMREPSTFSLLPSSIRVTSTTDEHWFSTFFKIEETYATLLKNWKLKDKISGSLKPKSNKERLKLPKEEGDVLEYSALFFRKEKKFPGTLVVSNHFLSFLEPRKTSTRKNRVVIPYALMDKIQKERMIPDEPLESLVIEMKGTTKLFAFDTESVDEVLIQINKRMKPLEKDSFNLPASWSTSCMTDHFKEYIGDFEFSEDHLTRQEEARQKFQKYFLTNGDFISMIHTRELTDLCKGDVPYELCGHIWSFCSGSIFKQYLKSGYYNSLLQQYTKKDSLALLEIEKDLPRTFPEHSLVKTEEGLNIMRRILSAYSYRNPSVGYCQSMNYVCTFLLFLMPEEQVFWLLCSICEDLMPKYYSHDMLEARADQMALVKLMATYLPNLTAKFEVLGVDPIIFVLSWFLCIFICHFPIEGLMLLLSRFFNEGKKVLFQVTLATFDIAEETLLQPKLKRSDHIEAVLRKTRQTQWKKILEIAQTKYAKVTNLAIDKIRQPLKAQLVNDIIRMDRFQKMKDLLDNSFFDPFELEEIHEKFIEVISVFSSTVIDFKQFQETGFHKLFPYWGERTDLCYMLFHMLDTKSDSLLDFAEYTLGLSILYRAKLIERLKYCLQLHDLQDNKMLGQSAIYCSFDAFIRLFQVKKFGHKLDSFVEDIFKKFGKDINQHHQIPLDELLNPDIVTDLVSIFQIQPVVHQGTTLEVDMGDKCEEKLNKGFGRNNSTIASPISPTSTQPEKTLKQEQPSEQSQPTSQADAAVRPSTPANPIEKAEVTEIPKEKEEKVAPEQQKPKINVPKLQVSGIDISIDEESSNADESSASLAPLATPPSSLVSRVRSITGLSLNSFNRKASFVDIKRKNRSTDSLRTVNTPATKGEADTTDTQEIPELDTQSHN